MLVAGALVSVPYSAISIGHIEILQHSKRFLWHLSIAGPRPLCKLLAIRLETEIRAEKRHHMILEAIGDRTGMRTVINLKTIGNSILVQHVVELTRVGP